MEKELNIIEAVNMPVGTEFKVILPHGNVTKAYVGKSGTMNILYWDTGVIMNTLSSNINAKFIPINGDKKVSFMEALEAYREGEEIYSVNTEDGEELHYLDNTNGVLEDENGNAIGICEILDYDWYIKE